MRLSLPSVEAMPCDERVMSVTPSQHEKHLNGSIPMSAIAPATNSLRKTTLDGVEHIWMLTIAFSIFQYAMAVDVAGRNAEAFAMFDRALRRSDASEPARASEISAEGADVLSAEERLASDERSAECKALGETMNNLTMPVRKELILASSVVC
jgi:hypothetical protein